MSDSGPVADVEMALERLFRLGANKRFDAAQRAAVGADVTRAGYAVLRVLADTDDLGVASVAESCVMDAATASRQVDRLVIDGLVRRRADATDARAVRLSLTSEGRSVYAAVSEYRRSYVAAALSEWNGDALVVLADTIGRLADDLAGPPRS